MNLHGILSSSPVNRLAGAVTSQRGLLPYDSPMSRSEIAQIVDRLSRKQRLLKRVLGIAGKSQHKNTIYKMKRGFKSYRADGEPRALVEYKRVGEQIQHLNSEICRIKKIRKDRMNAATNEPNTDQPEDKEGCEHGCEKSCRAGELGVECPADDF